GAAEELREQVAAGLLQGAFYIGPHLPRAVQGLALQTQYYRVAAPLARHADLLHAGWRDLATLPWIGAPAQHHVQTLLRDMFARQGLVARQVLECDQSMALPGLVRSGVGLALLREDQALAAAERGEVVVWPHARVGAQLSFIYPPSAGHDPATVATLSALRRVWGLAF
ncbi:MAG: substrate-binding domain-containing protein, partial [Proteobacteria bacterium]|nr:substrate-binding domain-containing protein [Pseudomonadota bacterium]